MQQWECHARWFRFIALAVLAIIIPASAAAQERCQDGEIVLNSATSSVRDLGSCIWYLEDPEHAVDFNDILSGDTAPFTRHEGGVLNFGYTESAYWARFDVEVGAGAALTDWILELALPLVDEVVLYLVRDGELIEQRRAGYEGDWSGRDLAVRRTKLSDARSDYSRAKQRNIPCIVSAFETTLNDNILPFKL